MIKQDDLVEDTNLIYAAGAEYRTLGANAVNSILQDQE